MKKYKFILTMLLVTSLSSIVYANTNSSEDFERNKVESEIRKMYENDPMYLMELRENGYDKAEEMIQQCVDATLEEKKLKSKEKPFYKKIELRRPFTHMNNVPVIKQGTSYWCGAAATLQVLYGMGKEDDVPGSTDYDKQSNIWPSIKHESKNSAVVYKIRNKLNNYVSSDKYSYKQGKDFSSKTNFYENLEDSVDAGRPPILHAKTEYLSYYNGKAQNHYIAIDGYTLDMYGGESVRDSITLSDCNWTDTYRGSFQVSYEEVYDCVADKDRYLIYHN